ncbi:MAG: hypothetical protein H0Z28_04115 [Archaeoglobus sp.]|nr:hypothetical protein [Archaeoglobus sp.]
MWGKTAQLYKLQIGGFEAYLTVVSDERLNFELPRLNSPLQSLNFQNHEERIVKLEKAIM